MFPKAILISNLVLALSVVATPVTVSDSLVTVSFAKQVNISGPGHIVQQDQARLKHLLSKAGAKHNAISRFDQNTSTPVPVENQAVSYIASVGVGECPMSFFNVSPADDALLHVGSPATYYDVIVDTGSSNTWVGANKVFVPTSTSVNTTQPIVCSPSGLLWTS